MVIFSLALSFSLTRDIYTHTQVHKYMHTFIHTTKRVFNIYYALYGHTATVRYLRTCSRAPHRSIIRWTLRRPLLVRTLALSLPSWFLNFFFLHVDSRTRIFSDVIILYYMPTGYNKNIGVHCLSRLPTTNENAAITTRQRWIIRSEIAPSDERVFRNFFFFFTIVLSQNNVTPWSPIEPDSNATTLCLMVLWIFQ